MAAILAGEDDQQQVVSAIDPLSTATLESEADDGSAITIRQSPLKEDVAAHEPDQQEPPKDQPKLEGGLDDLAPFIARQIGESSESIEPPRKAEEEFLPLPEVYPSDETKAQGSSRIMLKATGLVWFRVEDSRGNVIISQTLAKGETYAVPDREDLVIIARDGGRISYAIDGVDKGRLGTPGEIVVGRSLSVSRLMDKRG
jgi:cytoskeleton protein RodZ